MQFIAGGPDVPERLLYLHEKAQVVFFCGAGVSYAAGLPGYGDLVRRVYAAVGATPGGPQAAALKRKQYDTAVGLLEDADVGGRLRTRR